MKYKKAWILEEDDKYEVVFAGSKAKALKDSLIYSCAVRSKELDKYYPRVPLMVLMSDPYYWSHACDNCETMIGVGYSNAEYGVELEDAVFSKDGHSVFCCSSCRNVYFERSYNSFMSMLDEL